MTNEKRFPNSDSREEFLIVLEYLLKYAYDEKHASSQSKIIEYAKQHYPNVIMRRDRIGNILDHLYTLTVKHGKRFPFIYRQVKTKCDQNKYYIERRMFKNSEIVKIISSIRKDKTLTENDVKSITTKFLNISANEHTRKELEKEIDARTVKVEHIKDDLSSFIDELYKCQFSTSRIWFKLKKAPINASYLRNLLDHRVPCKIDTEYYGYVYKVCITENESNVILYVDNLKSGILISCSDVEFTNDPIQIGNVRVDVGNLPILGYRYKKLEEWADAVLKKEIGGKRQYVFKITLENGPGFEKLKKSYKEYFGKELPKYEVKERTYDYQYTDSNGNKVTKQEVLHDAYFTIEEFRTKFEKWYMDSTILFEVVVTEPKYINDYYISMLGERFLRRATKYGSEYEYEIKKTLRPEYEEKVKLFRENRIKRIKEKNNNNN